MGLTFSTLFDKMVCAIDLWVPCQREKIAGNKEIEFHHLNRHVWSLTASENFFALTRPNNVCRNSANTNTPSSPIEMISSERKRWEFWWLVSMLRERPPFSTSLNWVKVRNILCSHDFIGFFHRLLDGYRRTMNKAIIVFSMNCL